MAHRVPLAVLDRCMITVAEAGVINEKVVIRGVPELPRWFPQARVGIIGAFLWKRVLHRPPEGLGRNPVIRLDPQVAEGLRALLASAPLDRSSCYCGQCEQFREPERFRFEGHSICKACQSRDRYGRYYKVRREIVRESTDRPLTRKDWEECKAFFGYRCAYCGGESDLTRDHVVAIWNDGFHEQSNVVPACRSCNSKKGAQEMEAWYRTTPFYDEQRLRRIYTWLRSK